MRSMRWPATSRESGYRLHCELHGVEEPPTPFIGILSTLGTTSGATVAAVFSAGNAQDDLLRTDLDSASFEPQVNRHIRQESSVPSSRA